MSRVIYATNDFENQRSVVNNIEQDKKAALRISKRHNVGYRLNIFDELYFVELEDGQQPSFLGED